MEKLAPARRAMIALFVTIAVLGFAVLVFPEQAYSWVKAVHIIAVISWMAGMLYLPRLFVYHADAAKGSELAETFKVMERRLLRIIINPAMIVAWVAGLWLAWRGGFFMSGWFLAKLVLVVAMSAMHGYLAGAVRKFRDDVNPHSARHWRFANEVPTLLMIAIVVLVVVRPF